MAKHARGPWLHPPDAPQQNVLQFSALVKLPGMYTEKDGRDTIVCSRLLATICVQ